MNKCKPHGRIHDFGRGVVTREVLWRVEVPHWGSGPRGKAEVVGEKSPEAVDMLQITLQGVVKLYYRV